MFKIFYYEDETRNLLSEKDAEEVSLPELLDELFYLCDDNLSFIGIITKKNKYKVRSRVYNQYDIFQYNINTNKFYNLHFDIDYEFCSSFFSQLFEKSDLKIKSLEKSTNNRWITLDD